MREVLKAEGFAPLPRRLDEERPELPPAHASSRWPTCAPSPWRPAPFTTRCGGLFLFLPDLVRLDVDGAGPAARACRAPR